MKREISLKDFPDKVRLLCNGRYIFGATDEQCNGVIVPALIRSSGFAAIPGEHLDAIAKAGGCYKEAMCFKNWTFEPHEFEIIKEGE